MLTFNEAKKIGVNACIDKIGREFVAEHRDTSSVAYGENKGKVFCFVGVNDKPDNLPQNPTELMLDGGEKFPYSASCNVCMLNGTVDFLECTGQKKK